MTGMPERVASLRSRVEEILRRIIGERRVTAMVDFPNYPNVGDTAIYLGQLACLASLGIARPRFICDFRSYDGRALAEAAGDGVVLLTGGGSFGDMWPTGQECREDIMRSCRKNPIIQLPQTLHFEAQANLDRARAAVDGHGNVTILCRDDSSLEIARREFNVASELCPDMAFCIGSLDRPRSASRPIVWIARNDKESVHAVSAGADAFVLDWDDEPRTRLFRVNRALTDAAMRPPRSLRRALLSRRGWRELLPRKTWRSLAIRTYEPLARQRLRRGLDMLAAGNMVITDRLHGHILAMLLGIRHVILDNTYGKLSSFHRAWTTGVEGVHFAASVEEALSYAEAQRATPRRDAGAN